MSKNPPPPAIDDVFEGPEIGHGKPVRTGRKGKYYVRAVVDPFEDKEYGWIYQVVFRFYTRNKGWRYEIVSAHAIGLGLYTQVSKKTRRNARTP